MKPFTPHWNKLGLITVVLTILLVLAGCSSAATTLPSTPTLTPTATASPAISPSPTPSPSASPTATASPSPSSSTSPSPTPPGPGVFIVSPLYNVPVPPGDVTVKIKVSKFTIVNKIGQPNVPGEGHVIYYLDVTPPTAPGKAAVTAANTYVETADTSYTWPNLAAGNHTLSVQLVNNDGTPLNPAVTTTEPLPVVAPSPSPSPSATAAPSATP